MISQCSLCITPTRLSTRSNISTKMAIGTDRTGANRGCIRIWQVSDVLIHFGTQIVANIKAEHPEIPIKYHSHNTVPWI